MAGSLLGCGWAGGGGRGEIRLGQGCWGGGHPEKPSLFPVSLTVTPHMWPEAEQGQLSGYLWPSLYSLLPLSVLALPGPGPAPSLGGRPYCEGGLGCIGEAPGGTWSVGSRPSVEGPELLGQPSWALGAGRGLGWAEAGAFTPPSRMAPDTLSCRVTLSPRQGLPRIPLRGIFQGAKVVRGPDWEWGSQDGEWGSRVGGGAGLALAMAVPRGTGLAAGGALSLQEGKGSQAAWWTSVAGTWRQAGAWPA